MKRLISILLLSTLLCTALPVSVLADQDFASFSARAVLPENQVNSRNSYFDLQLEPGGEQTIELQVLNSSDRPMTANIALNPASSASGGLIVYDRSGVRDESMAHSIEDIATLRETQVQVPANGQASVLADLRMPEDSFDGVVLGGFVVTRQAQDTTESGTLSGGVALQNELAYIVGLQLRQTFEETTPELHLAAIEPGTVNYHTGVAVTLQNSEPVIMKGMAVEARVYAGDGEGDPLRTLNVEYAEMAPNSTCDFVIDWNNQPLQPGGYLLEMTARHEDRLWEWRERFEIGMDAASSANEQAVGLVELDENAPRWLISILLLALLAVIALTVWRIVKRRTPQRGYEGPSL